jgi:hypothetical protein
VKFNSPSFAKAVEEILQDLEAMPTPEETQKELDAQLNLEYSGPPEKPQAVEGKATP